MSSLELYSEQDVETKVIVPTLVKLGYDEQRNDRIILRFQHPIKVQQGREEKTIYADVVVEVDGSPVIVVDSKNPRSYLTDNDREQVISYARLIGNIAPYAVLCNGRIWQYYDAITKQQIKGLPAYKDLIKDLQTRRLSDNQRKNLVSQATRTLFAIDSTRELSRIMRRCHDIIRNLKGYDPTKAFDELSKLLFAKMYEEKEIAEERRNYNRFTLDTVKQMRKNGVEIIQILWRDTVSSPQYREVFSDDDSISEIALPIEAIDAIVEILQDKSLGLTDLDVKGVAFEEFLSNTFRGGGLGQFFTPREIVNFMVDMVQPAIGESCIDPSCGTGGFLIRLYDVVSEKIRSSEMSHNEQHKWLSRLANSSLAGIDWEPRASRTCKMNMIIHGDGHAGVYQGNSLDLEEIKTKVAERKRFYSGAPSIDEGSFDIVLTNPPFGARDNSANILQHYELGGGTSQKREVLMLERCIRLLKPAGRMAVVIPEGILSNKNDKMIRDFIRKNCIIKAVIRLPQDAFSMSQGAACTSVLYVQKKSDEVNTQGNIFFARAEHIGVTPSGKPSDKNDLPAILEAYKKFEQGEWTGIEVVATKDSKSGFTLLNSDFEGEEPWLEPEVNRTSILYDQLCYVLRSPNIEDRFSYTWFHPRYIQLVNHLDSLDVEVVPLESLCQKDFPHRGKKPLEEVSEGIPILKVRNITGTGIVFETDFAPDNEATRAYCKQGIVQQYDLLITCTGEGTIGRVDVYMPSENAIADGHVAICRLKKDVNWQYVLEFLRSEYGQIQILRHVSGSTGQTELLNDHVRGLLIPLPNSDVQVQAVEVMESAKSIYNPLIEQAEQLRKKASKTLALGRQEMLRLIDKKQN